jgi:hypothetical protein
MEIIKDNIIKEKAQFFLETKKQVHIATINSRFYNGSIIKIRENSLILNDLINGELLLHFSEIYDIEPLKEREEEK